MTTAQIMLIDILLDRIITASTTLGKVKTMTPEEIAAETDKWEIRKDAAVSELGSH